MKMQMLGRMLPFPMIAASVNAYSAKPSPAAAKVSAAASPRIQYCPAQPARLEMNWQMSAHGLVFRWVTPEASAAGEPASEEGSSLLLAV